MDSGEEIEFDTEPVRKPSKADQFSRADAIAKGFGVVENHLKNKKVQKVRTDTC